MLWKRYSFLHFLAGTLNSELAKAYLMANIPELAIQAFDASLQSIVQLKDLNKEKSLCVEMAMANVRISELEKANHYLDRAIVACKNLGELGEDYVKVRQS